MDMLFVIVLCGLYSSSVGLIIIGTSQYMAPHVQETKAWVWAGLFYFPLLRNKIIAYCAWKFWHDLYTSQTNSDVTEEMILGLESGILFG